MGRTILADDSIQTYVENLYKANSWYLGIIIGKLTNQKDYAVHIVRTPEPQEDRASEDDEEGEESVASGPERKRRLSKTQNKPASLEDMNEQWAATHAKQVRMMLPGGLDVIGIFALAPPAMMTKSQAKLRQILFAIQKLEKKSAESTFSTSITDRVLLQICSTTRKLTCRTIDVTDPKSSFRPADWKFQTASEKWSSIKSRLRLDLHLDIPAQSQTGALSKQIQASLQPFCQRMADSLVLINDTMRAPEEILDQTEKRGRGRDKGQPSQQSYSCSILLKHTESSGPAKDPSTVECCPMLSLRGTIYCQGFVVGKATVGDAQKAVQTDAIRSVLSRCELLCDDLQMIEEDAEKPEVYTMPRRVFFQLPGTSLELSDYMFTDEKPQEVLSRVQELLHITVNEEELDQERERALTEEDMSQLLSLSSDAQGSVSMTAVPEGSQGMKKYLVAGFGGLVAVVAAGLTYLASSFEET